MRLLVTGGTGLVGSNVLKIAREAYPQHQVIASVFERQLEQPWKGAAVASLNLEDESSIEAVFKEYKPQAVIHCAAPRDEDRLESDHRWGWRVMVKSTQKLAEACRKEGAKLVFVSSDWVFGNGGITPYAEDEPPCPVNYFGFLKAMGEALVASICPNYAIVRIAGVFGINWASPFYEQTSEGIGFGWLVNYYYYRLNRGEPLAVWTKHYNILGNPTFVGDIAARLLHIATEHQQGLLHVCGRESVSRLELARAVAKTFEFSPALIRGATEEEMDVQRLAGKLSAPQDSRLAYGRSETALGKPFLSLEQGLAEYRRQQLDLLKTRN
jgi:dTDP-4-dehydrorhamnose reductase